MNDGVGREKALLQLGNQERLHGRGGWGSGGASIREEFHRQS